MGCCKELTGVTRNCDPNIGGIRQLWAACRDQVTKPTPTGDKITALTFQEGAFHKYEFRKQTSSFTSTFTADDASGTRYWTTAVAIQFSHMDTPKRLEVAELAVSDLVMIVEDNNGHYWYLGYDFEMYMTDGTAETGTAFDDLNGYTLTITDMSKNPPYEVDESVMAPILAQDSAA